MTPDERMIYLDKLQEDGRKMGFIRSIPNIAKIPEPVFQEILTNNNFYFEIKNCIPMNEWDWNGQILNIAEKEKDISDITINVFKLNTTIGNFNISTVGSLWTPSMMVTSFPPTWPTFPASLRNVNFRNGIFNLWHCNLKNEELVFDYETMVFTNDPDLSSPDVECFRTLDRAEATAYHYLMCAYYSVLEKE